jgi:hypothetical protein
MKKILILVLITLNAGVFAQVFAPIGALWHYTQNNHFPPNGWTFKTIESIADTIINGLQCKKMLEIERNYDDTLYSNYQYMYSENDSVFFFENGSFHLLYSFGAESGDTLTLDYFLTFDGSPLTMIIDSTGMININGTEKRIQYITCGDGIMVEFGNQVIEGIGSTYYMFPVYDGMVNGPLRCYQDSVVGLFLSPFHPNYGWNYKDCGEIITAINENVIIDCPIIYPNPSNGRISIKNINLPLEFFILDIYGRVIKKGNLTISREIQTDDISNGVYFIELLNESFLGLKQLKKSSPFLIIN